MEVEIKRLLEESPDDPRRHLDQDRVRRYAEVLDQLPPVTIFELEGPLGFPPKRGGLLLGRGRLVGGQVLVGDGAQHMGTAVPPAVIVEVVAPGQHDGPGMIRVEQLVARQDFPFQAGEERLRRGIVETRSDPAHGLTNA